MSTLATHIRTAARLAPPKTLLGETAASIARARETYPVRLFQAMAVGVPAYRDFLNQNNIAPDRIRTAADLRSVPPVSRANYLTKYPLEKLCWGGTLEGNNTVLTSTSGSTGEPFFFPRDAGLDRRSALMHELYLCGLFGRRVPPTLVIDCFVMGVWIGGLITYQAFRYLSEQGHPLSIVTPGAHKKALELLMRLAPRYQQVIFAGYPPFTKDMLDEAKSLGFDAAKRPLKLLFAAEAFNETFRDYVLAQAGGGDPCTSSANVYGSADIGTMAIETPVAISLRRRSVSDPALQSALFPEVSRLPTFAQFHPALVNFEEENGELLVSGDSALPLLRYAIGDRGGVKTYDEVMGAARQATPAAVMEAKLYGRHLPPLPFVHVYERADFSVKLYGAFIHAEHARAALQDAALTGLITGKLSMATKVDERQDQYLDVHVELKPGIKADAAMQKLVRSSFAAGLKRTSVEFKYLADQFGERVTPQITLWPHQDPRYFSPGGKQRWINKN